MTLGRAPFQEPMLRPERGYCDKRLSETSVYRLLALNCHLLFPDDAFADLFRDVGRRSVPPRIVAVVMTLQRIEGLSDREAVDRFAFDLRWKYAAGVAHDFPEFVHTVLVDMRARLRESERPNRIFDAVLDVCRQAGLVGKKRVLDSTALYDAVATQDTVTMIRSALRGLLRVANAGLAGELRVALKRDDDYASAGKPACDWDDAAAREALVDALVRDANAALALLDGMQVAAEVKEAALLLATVVGQDIEQTDAGLFRIARRVAPDRVISTVDPEARHGHKTSARGFDGYKGHIAIDPESEIITATEVTPGNVGDAAAAKDLLKEALAPSNSGSTPVEIYGDASYGSAELVEHIENAGAEANVKVQPPSAKAGMFSQDAFSIDTQAATVTCPAGQLVQLRTSKDGSRVAEFGEHCHACPLRAECTLSKEGRTIRLHPKHDLLDQARKRQRDPGWRARYRATRPKVERKFAHLMRRRHGGRCARLRGRLRVAHDFAMLAAAANLSRLAALKAPLRSVRSI